jgi:hypothetical protein
VKRGQGKGRSERKGAVSHSCDETNRAHAKRETARSREMLTSHDGPEKLHPSLGKKIRLGCREVMMKVPEIKGRRLSSIFRSLHVSQEE